MVGSCSTGASAWLQLVLVWAIVSRGSARTGVVGGGEMGRCGRADQQKRTQDFLFSMILFIYSLERGEGKEKRGRETSVCGCLSHAPYWGPGAEARHVPWELNWRPFGLQAGAQSTEPHQPGPQDFLVLPRTPPENPLLSPLVITIIYFIVFFNPHPRICLLILDRGEEKGGWRERARERDIGASHTCPDRDRTRSLLLYGTTVQLSRLARAHR